MAKYTFRMIELSLLMSTHKQLMWPQNLTTVIMVFKN
jgi:hypothetical protein